MFVLFRDIVMVKDVNEMKTCGWHVDDIGFWPVSYHNTSGINVWIALDDMKYSGNMALAPKSHTASWRHEAYTTLGQNRTIAHGPTQEEVREAQSKHTHYLTCDMHLVNETISNIIESTAVYIDNVERGDIIFSSRLLFHRTMPVTPDGIQFYHKQSEMTNEPQFLSRYSIRYEPGNAQINNGWNVEWSVLHDEQNAGRSLNEIASSYPNLPFYPQVWPTTERQEVMNHVAQHAETWKTQAKQLVYDTLFASYPTSASATIDDTTTVTGTAQYSNEKEIETG
jgi:Phytanoyl-CoA dioxygenase (PhyH)